MSETAPTLTALVLAGRRPGPPDAMEAAEGVTHKAFIDIGGAPMISRVFATLEAVDAVADIVVAAPEESRERLKKLAGAKPLSFTPAAGTPATSVYEAILKSARGLLVTTSDHPLLTPGMVRHFLRKIDPTAFAAAAACVDAPTYTSAYPGTRRTFIRLSDLQFSGANLFWFSKDAAEPLLLFWRALEARRKNPASMAATIGFGTLLRYAVGALSSAALVKTIEAKTGVAARLVPLPQAEAAMDVDKPEDLELVRRVYAARAARPGPSRET
ncbi:MAG: nucleotidyltransferase family protein [Parvularculaceae bacterium]